MAILVAGALLVASAGAIARSVAGPAPGGGRAAEPMTVQQLAAAVGCQPTDIRTVVGYREARCTVDGVRLALLDSDAAEIAHQWVDYAVIDGVVLVGDRWAVAGTTRAYLETVRTRIGGEIRDRGVHG